MFLVILNHLNTDIPIKKAVIVTHTCSVSPPFPGCINKSMRVNIDIIIVIILYITVCNF